MQRDVYHTWHIIRAAAAAAQHLYVYNEADISLGVILRAQQCIGTRVRIRRLMLLLAVLQGCFAADGCLGHF